VGNRREKRGTWERLFLGPLLLVGLLLATTGCQFTQSAFVRTVGNAGAGFAAASTTLSYVHEGKITAAYARSSFMNYQSNLDGIDQQLPSQSGAPDANTVRQLLDLYRPAMRVVDQPCLDASCDWRAQVKTLEQASKAFLKAGGQ